MRVSRKHFDHLLEQALASLPPDIARWLDEVPVIVEDRPPRDIQDRETLGVYVGNSLHEDQLSGDLPPRIMIYREPLMDACDTGEQLAEEIRKTLFHELGHHAGMDEEELDARGYGPLKDDNDIDFDIDENSPS